MHIENNGFRFLGEPFDPNGEDGPLELNKLHINSVTANDDGMYIGGLHTNGMLHFNGKRINMSATLPAGTHNAQPFEDGVLFNDTSSDCVRYAGRNGESLAFKTEAFDESDIDFADVEDADTRRQGFARGLCTVGDRFVAAGSSPSTISLYDFESEQKVGSVNLSLDIRNAIQGLTIWPFDNV